MILGLLNLGVQGGDELLRDRRGLLAGPIAGAMAANGSPAPVFETDDDRTAYLIRLPINPLALQPQPPTPEVTPEVTPDVNRVIVALQGEMSRQDLQAALHLKDAKHFREAYLQPALAAGAVEMTLSDAPHSSKQRYRLTASGERARARLGGGA